MFQWNTRFLIDTVESRDNGNENEIDEMIKDSDEEQLLVQIIPRGALEMCNKRVYFNGIKPFSFYEGETETFMIIIIY